MGNRVLLILHIVSAVIFMAAQSFQHHVLTGMRDGRYDEEQEIAMAKISDVLVGFSALFYVVVFIILAVFICMWIHRSHHNLFAMGTRGLEYTPGWSVGWFFVPIMTLWKPYGAMKELWMASLATEKWKNRLDSNLLPIW